MRWLVDSDLTIYILWIYTLGLFNFSLNNLNFLQFVVQILPDYKENLLKLSMNLFSIIITNSRNTLRWLCKSFKLRNWNDGLGDPPKLWGSPSHLCDCRDSKGISQQNCYSEFSSTILSHPELANTAFEPPPHLLA